MSEAAMRVRCMHVASLPVISKRQRNVLRGVY
jgi:hypothetical protein